MTNDALMHYLGGKLRVPDYKNRVVIPNEWRDVMEHRLKSQGFDPAQVNTRVLTLFRMKDAQDRPYIECVDRIMYPLILQKVVNSEDGLDYRLADTAYVRSSWHLTIPPEAWKHGCFGKPFVYLIGNKNRNLQTFEIWNPENAVAAGLLAKLPPAPAVE